MASLRYNHNLTSLYNDTKRKAAINVDKQEPSPAPARLNRKLHAQTDRLVTWGLEWAEETNDSIDESVERAGLTENVTNILGNIKDILEQADRLSSHNPASDKFVFNQDKYEDLLRDLTSSVDVLYDLSASRRAIARGTYPKLSDHSHDIAKRGLYSLKTPFDAASFASSEKNSRQHAICTTHSIALCRTTSKYQPTGSEATSRRASSLRIPRRSITG